MLTALLEKEKSIMDEIYSISHKEYLLVRELMRTRKLIEKEASCKLNEVQYPEEGCYGC